MKGPGYKRSITVDAKSIESFESINSVSQWWTEKLAT